MAGLGNGSSIPASRQFGAVAWLRWRLFVNGFRRKGGIGELVARIIVFPIAALFVTGPVAGATAASYYATLHGHLGYLMGIFWGIFVLQILVSINISPPGLSFDPESLIRFPLSFARYLTIRLFLGLLSASTVFGTCALLGVATGVSIADRALAPVAFGAAVSLALFNMLFVRMVFAWIDRWLSTRRARELFTFLIFAVSIGIQYVNVTFNNLGHRRDPAAQQARIEAFQRGYARFEPFLHHLPPGLAGSALIRSSEHSASAAYALILGVLLFALACLATFGWRMQREYRGEMLSEGSKSQEPARKRNTQTRVDAATQPDLGTVETSTLSPAVAACFEKEWIYVRRNPAQFYGLIAPLAMVFLFAGRLGGLARSGIVFPAAVAYSVLGIAALAYNVLGLDGSGVQFYFMAPVKLRSVFLAKNLFGFAITAVQVTLVYLVVSFTAGPPSIPIALSTVCWVVFACLTNTAIGNIRSVTAPKKMDPSKISRRQTSQLSALMCLGIMLAIAAGGAGLIGLSRYLGMPWLPVPILLTLALGAFALYRAGLDGIDKMALNRRETLIEELSKAS